MPAAAELSCGLFLGSFTKFRKVTISFVISIRMEQRPTGQIFIKYFYFNIFESISRILKFHPNLTKTTVALHEHLIIFIMISPSVLLKMRKFSEKNYKEIKSRILYTKTFLKFCLLWDNVEKYSRTGQATNDYVNMLHENSYKLTFRISKIYSFSTATMIARTRLNVTL